ncbi:LuxR C-terminal-related transcriptional regulator [Sinosporangium siamense]|uniref:HTH luxR-type domain-containing protein n=1 Tax=Sinosporangium siamense TaxID=1367973 RepID=A0A919RNU2_9ACTN|nr:LuxR C-terminal-related transcriptional regulator [Sinosporangium siamense]GII95636.1 hypothetical protein Ssi02_58670 [Sinosporangium siamense]
MAVDTPDREKSSAPLPRSIIRRDRLHRRLQSALDHPLTAVVGPAGSGKTVLVRTWLDEQTAPPHVWISLDDPDRPPGGLPLPRAGAARSRFWALVADAVIRSGKMSPGIAGTRAYPLTRGTPASGTAAGVGTGLELRRWLVESLARLRDRLILVIDDADPMRHPMLAEDLALLARRAPRLRTIVLARTRVTAACDTAEIRAEDLAFTRAEAAQLLQVADLPLSEEDLDVIMAHSRGWPVAVRLMAYELAATYHFHQLIRHDLRPSSPHLGDTLPPHLQLRQIRAARDFRVLSDLVHRHWGGGAPPRPELPKKGQDTLLSPRERVVLAHLRSLSTVEEIARDLYVSPNTLKTQLRSIYRKLGVTRRREAVTVAEQMGWLDHGLPGVR